MPVTTHTLKISDKYFGKILCGDKKAEFRRSDDRCFKNRDLLVLREIKDCGSHYEYTGRELTCRITDVTKISGVYPDLKGLHNFSMLSIYVIDYREGVIHE
ncbi:TPA: DUF3850 domain-containing protein [Morganella morganii]|nr:DUF3850 domain-containing protein [Morganella morganii]HCT7722711.1 DUF3850 domain-containing protein [Morganella morganii]